MKHHSNTLKRTGSLALVAGENTDVYFIVFANFNSSDHGEGNEGHFESDAEILPRKHRSVAQGFGVLPQPETGEDP